MSKESFIEILTIDLKIFQHFAAIKGSCPINAKYIAWCLILSMIYFAVTAQILLSPAVNEQTSSINDTRFPKQFTGGRAAIRVPLERIDEGRYIVRLINKVGVRGKIVLSLGGGNCLIVPAAKTAVFRIPNG